MATLLVEKRGFSAQVPLHELHLHTGARYVPQVEFEDFGLLARIARKSLSLHKRRALTERQLWLGAYFQKELLAASPPEVSLRWIDDEMGWGIFAKRDFQPMQFIAEYSGLFRRKRRGDDQNAYCFECPLIRGESSRFLIDARDFGGISRYINHSDAPNLESALATVLGMPHVLLLTSRPIKKGEELRYDYGTDYWKRRRKR